MKFFSKLQEFLEYMEFVTVREQQFIVCSAEERGEDPNSATADTEMIRIILDGMDEELPIIPYEWINSEEDSLFQHEDKEEISFEELNKFLDSIRNQKKQLAQNINRGLVVFVGNPPDKIVRKEQYLSLVPDGWIVNDIDGLIAMWNPYQWTQGAMEEEVRRTKT